MLSDSHQVALDKLSKQMREHNLEWTRPITSRVFEGAERDRGAVIARSNTKIISTYWIRRLLKVDGSWKSVEDCCRWIPMYRKTIYYPVAEEPVVHIETDPTDSPLHFTADDIPLGDETSTAAPYTDFTSEFAHLRASMDQISIEHVKTRVHIEKIKAALLRRSQALSLLFLPYLKLKTGLFLLKTMFSIRRSKLKKHHCPKKWIFFENYNALTTQLSELVDYINRGGDAKKGEMSSSRGPPPPDGQNRSGGSSRSEPPKKRGGGSQSSSRQRGKMRCGWYQQATPMSDARAGF
ncbi:Kinesin-like protein [Dorcoceras hygrometricum]|uniref:Kinesin-like protein n=1 Tax=Dorcoceras hygrometricum TaxID=472368 RepID=A0A2Z7CYE4_9LAMI|nr:Kinesin-like protein [Dorcoceras hygrometricum]